MRKGVNVSDDALRAAEHRLAFYGGLSKSVLPRVDTKFQTQYNYEPSVNDGKYEVPYGESMTVPGQAMTIVQLMNRHAQGLPLTVKGRDAQYFGDDDIPEVEKMDFAERRALADYLRDHTKELKVLLDEAEKQRKADEKAEKEKEEKEKADKFAAAVKEAANRAD